MKGFGHIGDPERRSVPAEKVPVFDQSHVDYLKAQFRGELSEINLLGGAEAVLTAVAIRQGEASVIAHIQALITNAKAQS